MKEGLNRVVLFGNLGADPELRRLSNGHCVLKMRLATGHTFLNREGVREEKTEWHRVSLWGNRGEGLSRILHKGSFVLVEGHIQTSSYEKDGQKRYSTEVNAHNVILGGRCGPSGHEDADAPDDGDRPGDAETLREDGLEPSEADALRAGDSEPPLGSREADTFEPTPTPRPPRGDSGAGGAAAPPPPPPRKKARSNAGQSAMAAA